MQWNVSSAITLAQITWLNDVPGAVFLLVSNNINMLVSEEYMYKGDLSLLLKGEVPYTSGRNSKLCFRMLDHSSCICIV